MTLFENDFLAQPLDKIEHLGFTGSRAGMTPEQKRVVVELLHELPIPRYIHHGDCIGSDVDFHHLIRGYHPSAKIVGHPPFIGKLRAYTDCDEWRPPLPYLVRDEQIVLDSDFLIATPSTEREVIRSTTWATVRFARRFSVPHKVVLPNGEIHAGR